MGNVKKVNEVRTTVEQLLNAPYGMQGANIISNVSTQLGSWYCIIAIADNTTLDLSSSGTDVNWTVNGVAPSVDLDLVTGLPYYGDFKGVQLVDGSVIAYSK